MEFDRRQVLRAAVIAAIAPKEALASPAISIEESPLTPETLEDSIEAAAESLYTSIPRGVEFDYLRTAAQDIFKNESQMYVPEKIELQELRLKAADALKALFRDMHDGGYGIFIFADADEKKMSPTQRMYVFKKNGTGRLQCMKAYRISTSSQGFGNAENSGQTPLGMHHIAEVRQGIFGQVVSGRNPHRDLFNKLDVSGKEAYFVKSFGGESLIDDEKDIAEVVTDAYLLSGENTPVTRGIRIHGTNRSGERLKDGAWKTFLDGRRLSGGCVRMANIDVRDLSLSGYVRKGEDTPIMLYATSLGTKLSTKPKPKWLVEY